MRPIPWIAEGEMLSEGYCATVRDADGRLIADHLDDETARVTAAAPDLAKALELLVTAADSPSEPIKGKMTTHEFMMQSTSRLGALVIMALPAARAALAKAKGES